MEEVSGLLIFIWTINLVPRQYNCVGWAKFCVFAPSGRRTDKQSITLIGVVFCEEKQMQGQDVFGSCSSLTVVC